MPSSATTDYVSPTTLYRRDTPSAAGTSPSHCTGDDYTGTDTGHERYLRQTDGTTTGQGTLL